MPAFTTIIQQVVMVIRYSFHDFVLQMTIQSRQCLFCLM